MSFDRVTFAAKRRKSQEEIIAALEPVVARALEKKAEGSLTWWRVIVDASHPLFDKVVGEDGGDPTRAKTEWAHLALDLVHSLTKTKAIHDYSATLIATWVSSNILSYGTIAAANQAGEAFELEWITMHDSKVRTTHKEADGQKVKPGRPFRVGTSSMKRPGDVTAPIAEWINCRCSVAAVPVHDKQAASVHTDHRRTGATMNDMITRSTPTLHGASLVAAIDAAPDGSLIPWHGILTVEGEWSGDRRKFQKGSLSHRDLPLPLTFQKVSAPGHDNNVTVASIDWLEKRGDAWHGGGSVLPTPEADEMVGLLAHFKQFGVSVDADMAEMSFVEYDGAKGPSDMDDMPGQEFSAGRICGACVVGIPAFQQAFVTLGEDPDHDYGADAVAASIATLELDGTLSMEVSTFTLPSGLVASIEGLIDCPVGAVCTHPDCTDTPTKVVSTDRPDLFVLFCDTHAAEHEGKSFAAVEAGRGPGWITNPEDTKRIHDYWTVPGMPGYAKIGWGIPGDFNRCRLEVGEEIGEGSPDKLRFINQICAQWHHDATGFWPGHAPAEVAAVHEGEMAAAVALVASTDSVYAPAEWFTDPKFTKKTHFTVTDDGEVLGHVADWETCHMGFNQPGVCMRIEPSTNGYAYFLQGEVLTTEGPVATGPLTLSTGHANGRLSMRPAIAHYDNTGTAVADVVCGDDEFGVWVHGWVRPWVSEEKKYELRAHPPSIDQRRNPNTGDFDLIAILSVNAPGLPVLSAGIENGVQMSLIASLAVEEETTEDPVEALAQTIVERLEARQIEREQFEALELEEV